MAAMDTIQTVENYEIIKYKYIEWRNMRCCSSLQTSTRTFNVYILNTYFSQLIAESQFWKTNMEYIWAKSFKVLQSRLSVAMKHNVQNLWTTRPISNKNNIDIL